MFINGLKKIKDDEKRYTYQKIAENIDINGIYKVIIQTQLEQKGKGNISLFINEYSTKILVSRVGKSLDNGFI